MVLVTPTPPVTRRVSASMRLRSSAMLARASTTCGWVAQARVQLLQRASLRLMSAFSRR
jgi:hypothetical protein